MYEREIKKYRALNALAESGGIVIFGGTEDQNIPLCELKQAFALNPGLYNRSMTGLSVKNAAEAFDSCVAELHPEEIFLHIGAADLQYFSENAAAFDQKFRELIAHIRVSQKKCQIIVVSLGNPDESAVIAEMNSHLKVIAESERCVFGNISTKRVWNPVQTKDVISFVYSTGFMRPLKNNHPIYDMVKILFGFEAGYAV